jgi:OOP family OmpA-OmpF porin
MRRVLLFLLLVTASPLAALDLAPPGSTELGRDESPATSVRLPREPWRAGTTYSGTEGAIERVSYGIPNPALTTLQLITPVREKLVAAGYRQVFTCANAACGGFDFRFQLDLLPAPAMHVDLGDFRYALLERAGDDPRLVSLVASTSASSGFLHVTTVSDSILPDPVTDPPISETSEAPRTTLVTALLASGHTVLTDLDFAVGSANLGPGPFSSLAELSSWLADNPGARIVLVGHTDAVGSLDANEALSRERARSVLDRLTGQLGVAAEQVQAEGAGALSPVASNLTDEGRAANRRVEVVLLTLE